MLLSVIIPAFNEARIISDTLNCIREAMQGTDLAPNQWEIIVCDNNSTDKTDLLAAQWGAKVIFEPVNQISQSRNTGASVANGQWLLFIDADTFPDHRLMEEVLSLLRSGEYIGCGSTIEVTDGTLLNKLRMERLNPLFKMFNFCGGAFLLCEKTAFDGINGFSTKLYAYEEIDFVIRLKKFGRKRGRRFKILSQHPVSTSGRKADYTFPSLISLLLSGFTAPVLFLLNYVLPKKVIRKVAARTLTYWYSQRK